MNTNISTKTIKIKRGDTIYSYDKSKYNYDTKQYYKNFKENTKHIRKCELCDVEIDYYSFSNHIKSKKHKINLEMKLLRDEVVQHRLTKISENPLEKTSENPLEKTSENPLEKNI